MKNDEPLYTFRNGLSPFKIGIDFGKLRDVFIEEVKEISDAPLIPASCMNVIHANIKKEFENMSTMKNPTFVPGPAWKKNPENQLRGFRWDIENFTIDESSNRQYPKVEIHLIGSPLTPEAYDCIKYNSPTAFYNSFIDAMNGRVVANLPVIKDVIFNPPATIVFWKDGTKTVVKCQNEDFDPEKGLTMAYFRKAHGDKYEYFDVIRKYVGRYEKQQRKNFAREKHHAETEE